MARTRSFRWLLGLGTLWAALAVSKAAGMYGSGVRLVDILILGIMALIAGLFYGHAIQKKRMEKSQSQNSEATTSKHE
jgi:uncharacterized protein HemX